MILSHRQSKKQFVLTTSPLLISTMQMKVKNNAILILNVTGDYHCSLAYI